MNNVITEKERKSTDDNMLDIIDYIDN